MRWLIAGKNFTSAGREALGRHEHKTFLPADFQLAEDASFDTLVKAARKQQLDLITCDAALTRYVTENGIGPGRCMVFIQLPGEGVEQDDAIDRLFARYRRLSPGKVYTVTETRVKVRQFGLGHLRKRDEATREAELDSPEVSEDDQDFEDTNESGEQ